MLNLIIRADARGSLEAIEKELSKLDHPEVDVRILQKSVGGITVADVTLASASQAVILGFNVIPDEAARALADERNVEIRRYDIIYKLAEDIRAILEGRLRPEQKVVELGRALVKAVFNISRVGAWLVAMLPKARSSADAEFVSIATVEPSATMPSIRSSASRKTSRKFLVAWNAVSS